MGTPSRRRLVVAGAGSGMDLTGVGLALLAGLAYATCAVTAATLVADGVAAAGAMAGLFGGAGLLLLPVLAATSPAWLLTARGSLVAAHLAVLTTAVAHLLYGHGLRTVPAATAATAATLSLAEPGGAALLGLLVLGEPATAPTLTGLALLVAALVVLTARRRGPARLSGPAGDAASGRCGRRARARRC